MKGLHLAVLLVALCACACWSPHRSPLNHALLAKWLSEAPQPGTKATSLVCYGCEVIVDGVQTMLKQNCSVEEMENFVAATCRSLKLDLDYVCDHMVNEFAGELFFMLARVSFTASEICGGIVSDCKVSHNPLDELWDFPIPGNKPPVQTTVPQEGAPTLRVLHVSDIHVDRHYAEGSEANCVEGQQIYQMCCINYPGDTPTKITTPSGKWGMPYVCDIPYRTFDSALKHIAQTEKLDYILFTGDFEAHNIWDYTEADTTSIVQNVSATFRHYFPNTPIWEAVGNHETVPKDGMGYHGMDEYDKLGPQWLFNLLASEWKDYLTTDAIQTVKYRGSYSVRPFPGLKIISVNSIYGTMRNLYMYVNQVDPDGTLTWLVQELLDSESRKEKVHIISHIPPGKKSTLKGWSHNYYEIVNRFESTIAAQFYGHTHQDEFEVYYEGSDPSKRATGVNFITPSLTTYSYNNPAYRIYTIDGLHADSTFAVLDIDTYATDVTEANKNDAEPKWFHTYSAREEYGMKDLSPASWDNLVTRMETDDKLFKKYWWNYYRNDGFGTDCDSKCKKKELCKMRSAKSHEKDLLCP